MNQPVVYLLVVWFGLGHSEHRISVPDLPSLEECLRLGQEVANTDYLFPKPKVDCIPYQRSGGGE